MFYLFLSKYFSGINLYIIIAIITFAKAAKESIGNRANTPLPAIGIIANTDTGPFIITATTVATIAAKIFIFYF